LSFELKNEDCRSRLRLLRNDICFK